MSLYSSTPDTLASCPPLQVRICLVVPMYALTSWASFVYPHTLVYIETSRDW